MISTGSRSFWDSGSACRQSVSRLVKVSREAKESVDVG